jgi:hypothetical protein
MSNKHEAREPGTSPARLGSMRARAGPTRISGPGSDRKLGTTRLPLSLLSPLFCTKTCLPARFFHAKWTGPARLGPLRTGLGQGNKPAGLDGPAPRHCCTWDPAAAPASPRPRTSRDASRVLHSSRMHCMAIPATMCAPFLGYCPPTASSP